MIKLSKLTDYGIVVMTYFARAPGESVLTARQLASMTRLPIPTVGKVLKTLSRGGLLISHRGVRGGYSLARAAREITVVEMVRVLEGPVGLTECSSSAPGLCEYERCCPVRTNWQLINETVATALSCLTLADMANPMRRLPQRGEHSHLNIV